MPAVADVVRQHAPAYLERFGEAVPRAHRKVLGAIADCRTGRLGTVVFACKNCERRHRIGRSCGNRHCPGCQHDKGAAWLNRQTGRLLPCPYFLLTFTLPAELRALARAHPRTVYDAFFRASSDAIKALAADPKYIGTPRAGFFGVLHTWGRQLPYHPHLHYVMPGGGPSADGEHWLAARADFLMPAKPLSRLFRGKFRDAMRQAGLIAHIDPAAWTKDWVVDIQATGDGRSAIRYLAPYIFRVAVSDRRIRSCTQDHVTFTWHKTGSRRPRALTLEPDEFLRRFLQHVLPRGFQKVRYYGFLCANAGNAFDHARWLATLHARETFVIDPAGGTPPPVLLRQRCQDCGGEIRVVRFLRFRGSASFDSS
jgi:hypothetical protein